MHFGVKSLLAAAVLGLSGLAAPAGAQDTQLVSYEELLERVARLEEDVASAPAPDGGGEDGEAYDDVSYDDGGFYAVYENVIVTPYFSQNTSIITLGPGVNNRIREFNWDLEYSPRIEIGSVDGGTGTGWRARYWHFDHSADDRGVIGAGAIGRIQPSGLDAGIIIATGNTAQGSHSLRMSVLDLEMLKRDISEDGGFTASVGLRYARMDQHLRARELNAAGVLQESLRQQHDFEGIGPTIAAEYLKRFDCSYWGTFVNARGALLYGESNVRYDRRNGANVQQANQLNLNDQDLMGVVEMQIGLDYRRPTASCHEIFLRVALEAQYWANAGSASADLGDNDANGSAQDADLGFLGITIATGIDW